MRRCRLGWKKKTNTDILSYEDIKHLKIKKLDKVCDKAFLFISNKETSIPFQIVSQLQVLGKTIKWIPVECSEKNVDFTMKIFMSFWIGKLHEHKYLDVEFAILSDDTYFDNLIQLIRNDGRSCQRIVDIHYCFVEILVTKSTVTILD